MIPCYGSDRTLTEHPSGSKSKGRHPREREISRKLLKGSLIIQYSMPTNLRIVPSTSSKAAVIVRKQNKTVLTYKVSSDITNQPAILHDKFKPVIEVTLIVS